MRGWSFSWSRFIGLAAFKNRIARTTGIPTTREGRQRKLGRTLGCGCIVVAAPLVLAVLALLALVLL